MKLNIAYVSNLKKNMHRDGTGIITIGWTNEQPFYEVGSYQNNSLHNLLANSTVPDPYIFLLDPDPKFWIMDLDPVPDVLKKFEGR